MIITSKMQLKVFYHPLSNANFKITTTHPDHMFNQVKFLLNSITERNGVIISLEKLFIYC